MTEAVQKFPLNIIGNPKAGKKQAKVCPANFIQIAQVMTHKAPV